MEAFGIVVEELMLAILDMGAFSASAASLTGNAGAILKIAAERTLTISGAVALNGMILDLGIASSPPIGTVFKIIDSTGPAPIVKFAEGPAGEIESYHEGRIEWTRRFKVPSNAVAGDVPLAGKVAWQMCKNFCLPATGFEFAGKLIIADEIVADAALFEVTATLKGRAASTAIDELRPGAVADSQTVDRLAELLEKFTPSNGISRGGR